MKLDKKGFTLIELLAVVVVLALLMIVVANTALPALNNAKKSSLETYAKRVAEKAKEKCMSDYLLSGSSTCTYTSIEQIMGSGNDEYQLSGSVTVTISNDDNITVSGKIQDSKNTKLGKVDLKTFKIATS